MNRNDLMSLAALLCLLSPPALAEDAAPLSALARMPVKEITVFKDGHAFVLHEGTMPVDAAGDVRMDYLPTPVLGTFWPYTADKNIRLSAVTASPRRVLVERTAITVKELLEANPGARIGLYDSEERKSYEAQIVEVPTRSAREQQETSPPDSGEKLPEKSNLILLKRGDGVQVVSLDRIQEMRFLGPYKKTVQSEEFRNLLTLKIDWQGAKPAKTAHVGMMYVQKGIRWIPSYKITLDGKGNATIRLQASLINEMTHVLLPGHSRPHLPAAGGRAVVSILPIGFANGQCAFEQYDGTGCSTGGAVRRARRGGTRQCRTGGRRHGS